jgi:hypothetical protein
MKKIEILDHYCFTGECCRFTTFRKCRFLLKRLLIHLSAVI